MPTSGSPPGSPGLTPGLRAGREPVVAISGKHNLVPTTSFGVFHKKQNDAGRKHRL